MGFLSSLRSSFLKPSWTEFSPLQFQRDLEGLYL